jgi:Ca2+-binding RTX toxin-like protein
LRKNDLRLDFAGDERYSVAVGARGADTLIGTDAGDHLFGRDGRDRLLGQGGDDVLQGDAGNDELLAGDGMDRLDGGSGNDRLFGGAMADEVMGMEGRDFLDGGAGHDMIEAGRGDDLVRGGTGADAFIVDPQSGFDLVLDFEAKGPAQGAFDHLALRDIGPEQVSVVDGLIGALVQWSTDADAQAEGGVLLAGVYRADLRQSDFMFFDAPGFVAGVSDYGSQYVFDGL